MDISSSLPNLSTGLERSSSVPDINSLNKPPPEIKRRKRTANTSASTTVEDGQSLIIQQLELIRSDISNKHDALNERFSITESKIEKEISTLRQCLDDTYKRIDTFMESINKRFQAMQAEIDGLKNRLDEFKQQLEADAVESKKRMIDNEARGRRNNLLVFGVEENFNENIKLKWQAFLRDNLGFSDEDIRYMRINRVHRLGRVKPGSRSPRPIIVSFVCYEDRESARLRGIRLAGTSLSMREDYPIEIREAQKRLLKDLKAAKEAGKRAKINYPARLIVNGIMVREEPIV